MAVSTRKNPRVPVFDYDGSSHMQVILRMHGSVWPKVLPFCLLNALVTFVVYYLHVNNIVNLTISPRGHEFMSLVVSFGIVTRANTTISRFMEMRAHLSNVLKACMKLVTSVGALTHDETDQSAREWRNDVSYHAMLVTRAITSCLVYRSTGKNAWDTPELDDEERKFLERTLYIDTTAQRRSFVNNTTPALRWVHENSHNAYENLRVPRLMAHRLEISIMRHRQCLKEKLPTPMELNLLAYVDAMLDGCEGLLKLLTTPAPFPMVQMSRTFLFFYVFTLPLALLGHKNEIAANFLLMWFITFGFIGIEYVSMELDDPFGQDANDCDCTAIAVRLYEFIYVITNEQDGQEYADRLRAKMSSIEDRTSNEGNMPSEKTWLLSNEHLSA